MGEWTGGGRREEGGGGGVNTERSEVKGQGQPQPQQVELKDTGRRRLQGILGFLRSPSGVQLARLTA